MPRNLIITIVALVALGAGFAVWSNYHQTPNSFALLNEDQLAEIAQYPTSKQRALTVTKALGPTIKVSAPSGFSLNSPVDFDITVEPRGDVAVDMASFRIEYRLGPVWVNLTKRVMRQASIKGSHFVARGAELPPGDHALRLTVRDELARTTQALVTFSVTK